jgi:hypothetical protein
MYCVEKTAVGAVEIFDLQLAAGNKDAAVAATNPVVKRV